MVWQGMVGTYNGEDLKIHFCCVTKTSRQTNKHIETYIISAILTNWDQLVIFMVFDPVNLTIGVKRDHFFILC